MTKLDTLQYIGIGLVILGFSTPFLIENSFFETISGILAAVGVALILKWFPSLKRNKIIIGTVKTTKWQHRLRANSGQSGEKCILDTK